MKEAMTDMVSGLRRTLAALGLSASVMAASTQLALADPVPSDGDVAGASAAVDREQGTLTSVVSQLADANAELELLDGQVEAKQQAANKAIEDLTAARAAATGAQQRAQAARDELRGAQTQVQAVGRQADELVELMYTNAGALSPELALIGAPDVQNGLDRAGLLQEIARDQRQTIEDAQRARNDEANRAAAANAADLGAQRATATAQQAKDTADQAVIDAKTALDGQRAKREALEQARDDAQRKLDEPKGAAQQLADQKQPLLGATPADDPATPPPNPGAAAPQGTEDQLAAQVAAQDPSLAQLIFFGATPAAGAVPPPSGGYVPRLYGQQAVETVIRRGLSQVGRIYSWGGGSPYGPTKGIRDGGVADRYHDYEISGYDCSGLVVFAFAGAGVLLPHYTGYQYRSGRQVPASDMRRGDLIFYGPNASEHVALYLGRGMMLESPQSGERVHVTPLRTGGMDPFVVRMF